MTANQPPEIKLRFAEAVQLLREKNLMVDASASGPKDPLVLTTDSRQATPKHAFLAYLGTGRDGHSSIDQTLKQNVGAVIFEDAKFAPQNSQAGWIQVTNARAAWSWLAAQSYGHPQKKLRFIGVTGTDGKTSTVWYCRQILSLLGEKSCTIGTLGIYLDTEFIETQHTTPDPPVLFAALARAVSQGIKHVAMECSSHSMVQRKLDPICFDALAFTSFSRDHLDLHRTMEDYYAAKWSLFTRLSDNDTRMLFSSSLPNAPLKNELSSPDVWLYGLRAASIAKKWDFKNFLDVKLEKMAARLSSFTITAPHQCYAGSAPLAADYAVENFSAALLLCEHLTSRLISPEHWVKIKPPRGRFEGVDHPQGPVAIVDYAHTPGALEKTLVVARQLCTAKLHVVFGCGGDRDRGKRPEMARIAAKLADTVMITSDNPRTEDPQAIINEIKAGLPAGANARTEIDRAKAIEQVLTSASPGDVIIIAGKGHETYQIIGTTTHPFDDRAVALKVLQRHWP